MPHLVDDGGRDSRYALPAYEALVSYGREHTVELLREFHAIDWQDGALVVCAAAFHGLSPSFVTDTHRQEWLSRIQEYESATPARRSRQHSDAKIAAAALYLDPRAASFLSGTRIPAYLQRMFEAGEGVAELAERAKWMASWFPMLDPYRPRRASFVISMGNAKRGPGSRNPE